MENQVVLVNRAAGNRPVKLSELGIRQVVDAGSVVGGSMQCASSIMVRGTVMGDVTVNCKNSMVIVHPEGVIHGKVTADVVVVAGRVEGGISCRGLRICRTATVAGDLECNEMRMDQGATLKSVRSMNTPPERNVVPPAHTAPESPQADADGRVSILSVVR